MLLEELQSFSRVLMVVMHQPSQTIAQSTSQITKITNREPNEEARPLPTPSSAANAAIAPKANVAQAELPPARRHPLRFVWDMDADGHFVIASDEFLQLIGPRAGLLGRPWHEIAAELNLDPHNQVANAVASRETWSGITVFWPVSWPASPAGSGRTSELRLPVELSGLPVFDRDRNFRGYRGFGVCRDLTPMRRLTRPSDGAATAPRLASVDDSASLPHAESLNEAELNDAAAAASDDTRDANPALANVVPFRPAAPADPKTTPGLTPVERRAFREFRATG